MSEMTLSEIERRPTVCEQAGKDLSDKITATDHTQNEQCFLSSRTLTVRAKHFCYSLSRAARCLIPVFFVQQDFDTPFA